MTVEILLLIGSLVCSWGWSIPVVVRQLRLDMPAVVVGSDDEFITPDGSTTLEEGDTLLALVKKENLDRVREILSPERRNDVRD